MCEQHALQTRASSNEVFIIRTNPFYKEMEMKHCEFNEQEALSNVQSESSLVYLAG